ncbi:hypothetical protein Q4I30_005604 [Leishmania utingensis]|uniref:Uncharacterized protein n=1 Tax=Leishmania utingensis TaxID=653362 RepID=A0AAW3AAW3_9TRYP
MASSLGSISTLITGASPAEASFYSLAYVSALQHCIAFAYGPTLKSVVSSTAATSVYGDGLAECVVRCRLETEREATERLRAILLQELPQTPARGRQRRNPSAALDVAGADQEGTSVANPSTGGRARPRNASVPSQRSSRASSSVAPFAKDGEVTRPPFLSSTAALSFPSSSFAQASRCDAAALLLLRIGLCRALGWPVPAALQFNGDDGDEVGGIEDGSDKDRSGALGRATQLADVLLSRHSYPNVPTSQRVTESSAAPTVATPIANKSLHMFMHMPDAELRQSVILEWVEDILVFAHYQGFTPVQTQCVLLDSLLILSMVDEHLVGVADAATHAAWEQRVGDALQEVLCAQTCLTATRTIDTARRYQSVTTEVPDPVQLEEITEKQHKATSQKALAALEAAKQSLPLVSQTVMQHVEVEVEKDVTLRAVFAMSEAAAIAEYITRSVVTHKRLWDVLLGPVPEEQLPSQPIPATAAAAADGLRRPVVHRPICVSIENVASIYLPSHSVFHSEALQAVVDAQCRLFEACESERMLQFSTDWQEPLLAIAVQELSERRALQEATAQADAEDKAAGLTSQQCARVERAYGLRLQDVLRHNAHVVRGAPPTASELLAAAATPEVAAAPLPGRVSGSKLKNSGPCVSIPSAAAAPALSTDAAASIVLSADAAFELAEVEARVDRIAAAVEEMNGPSTTSSAASQRAGKHRH